MTEEEKESAVGGTNDTSKVETSSVSNTEEGTKVEDDNVTENLASVVTETETASILIAATPIDNTKVLSSPQEQIPQIVASTPPDASPSTTHNDSKTKDDDNDVNDENNNNFTKTFTTVSKLVEGTEPTPFQLPVTIQENRGRKTKPLGCCEFPFGETVKCKWCIKNYHLKCLEPPLLYAPTSFVCERHLPDDIPPEPEPSDVPEAFSNYLLQSKVKLDWPLTKGETVSRKSLNTTVNKPKQKLIVLSRAFLLLLFIILEKRVYPRS